MNRPAGIAARAALSLLLVATGLAVADDYRLDWYTIDGGGEMFSAGGGYTLSGTIGQPDAQPPPVMTGGEFRLVGGFWPVGTVGPPVLRADMDCDGRVTFDDITPFVTALVGRAEYEAAYPDCRWLNGDIFVDGRVTFDDINPFVECLVQSGCP